MILNKKKLKNTTKIGHSQATLITQVNTIVTNIFIETAIQCSNTAATNQVQKIECLVSDPTQTPENSFACRNCFYNIYTEYIAYMQLQQNKWNSGGSTIAVDKPIEDDFHDLIQKGVTCGLSLCKKCVANNLSQQTAISSDLNCNALNNISNTIDQQLTEKVTSQLENHRDLLAPLASIFGGDSSNIVANIVSRIGTSVKQSDISKIIKTIENSQTINIIGAQKTVNISQSSATNSVMNYLVTNNITNNILTQEEWDILIKNINSQNTLGSLGDALVKGVSILADLATSLVGIIMIGIIVSMCCIVAATVIYIVVKIVQKKIKEASVKEAAAHQTVKW